MNTKIEGASPTAQAPTYSCCVPGCNQPVASKTGRLCETHRHERQAMGQKRTTLVLICRIRRKL